MQDSFVVSAFIEKKICNHDPWDEKRREAGLPLEFVVRMDWLEGQELLVWQMLLDWCTIYYACGHHNVTHQLCLTNLQRII